jgi:hypothetical protein
MPQSSATARQYAPATERNCQPILEVLSQYLPQLGNILEIASGTGEHALFFAPNFAPQLWIPSDPEPYLRSSIESWRQDCPTKNLQSPLDLDARKCPWFIPNHFFPITAILNINMIHISPWSACEGLMAGAGKILPAGGLLYLYGPFLQEGKPTAPSNLAFDTSLRDRNPEWGLRSLETVAQVAEKAGFKLREVIEMPANNLSVVWNRH